MVQKSVEGKVVDPMIYRVFVHPNGGCFPYGGRGNRTNQKIRKAQRLGRMVWEPLVVDDQNSGGNKQNKKQVTPPKTNMEPKNDGFS